ncbi:hypothetical protein M404DRAFT_164493 [Pisolithus tinctorius Marx 270]|uniref:Uncharacterized protein n=1 Tax=Pisolithus tinctorius Marx 270 TaxID=870435 RepID=A0A0C3N4J2_PISTI|nr:hypothetical protein M404DRAFT_164493 [Pisolithus tinctorius Marx 270]
MICLLFLAANSTTSENVLGDCTYPLQSVHLAWQWYVPLLLCFPGAYLPSTANITSLDVHVVACKDHWVITSPNVDFILELYIFEEVNLCPHADSQFILVDCFQWPQTYEKNYEYAVCIP